ncbi:MAG: ABC transporter permease [Nanoarchaeota archaeon]
MNSEYFGLALNNLRKRKLRSALTVLGIVIAVTTIFVLMSLSLGLKFAVAEQFRALGTDKIFIYPRASLAGPGTGGPIQLSIKDVNVVERVSGVKGVSYSVAAPAKISFEDEIRFFTVIGFPFEKSDVFVESGAYKSEEGRVLDGGDEGNVMVGSHYKHNRLFSEPVRARDTLNIQGNDFEVQAILEPIGNPGDDRLVYMSIEEMRELFNIPNRVDFVVAQIESGQDIKSVAEKIQKKLFNSRDVDEKTRDFTIQTPEELLSSFSGVLNIITGFLLAVAGISLLVGGIGIANTMYTSVLERTKEIGIMKAIGARNRDISSIFILEAGFLGLAGGSLGVFFGWLIGEAIEFVTVRQFGTTLLQTQTPLFLFLGCLVFAFFSGMFFGALPAIRAGKLRVVDSLRYE